MSNISALYVSTLFYYLINTVRVMAADLDVQNYYLTLEPNIERGFIKGTVVISFTTSSDQSSVIFNSGQLQVHQVQGESVASFQTSNSKLTIELSNSDSTEHIVKIDYSGAPTKGLLFNKSLGQAYTVYFTSHWMICHQNPEDKATIRMDVLISEDKQCIASGELITKKKVGRKSLYQWKQDYETPAYTYGFVVGNFKKHEMKYHSIAINNYSSSHSLTELAKIFRETPKIISFFEEKSGIPYNQKSYNQILIGNHYQEMSGFSILKETYGNHVLKDSMETNLISHELAHQWWGNRITCKNWNHFWLNEAVATFMSAAYNEYRFGREKYQSDINAYFKVYESVKNRKNDKPLVFDNWINPSKDDRNIVYFKGAYVLHLLRQEMGELAFWEGIKNYSKYYFDKHVTTVDFQNMMEESAQKELSKFFNKWVYME